MDNEYEDWSSGELELDEAVMRDMTSASEFEPAVSSNDNADDLFYNNIYYSSIKHFTSKASIHEGILLEDNEPLHYFELFSTFLAWNCSNNKLLSITKSLTTLFENEVMGTSDSR